MADQPIDRIYAEVGFKSTLDKDLSNISTSLNKAQSQVETFGKSISSGLGTSVTNLGSKLIQIGTTFSNSIGNAFTQAGQKVSQFGATLSNTIGNAFKTVGSEASAFGTNISKNVGNAFDTAGEKVKSFGGTISNSLGNSLISVGQKVIQLGTSISTNFGSSISSIGKTISTMGSQISEGFGNSFNTIYSKIQSFGSSLTEKLSSSFTSAKARILDFSQSAVNSFNSLVSSGKKVRDQLGLIGVALVAVFTNKLKNAIADVISIFSDFDDSMRQVQAITSSTGELFDGLTDKAKQLGRDTSFMAQDVADAMTIMGQAGFSANEIMSSIPNTLNLSRASMTDLTTTVDIMSAIMRSFNISANETSRVSDVLAKAANTTATDVTGLGEAMKYTSALAYQMGWSVEETAAAAGLLSNAGIKSSMAGTVLRNAITRLIDPTKQVIETLNSYGITLEMVNPKTHSLAEILDVLGAHAVSSGDLMQIFGMRAGPGMMALINQGTDALRKEIDVLQQSGGYAEEAAKKMDAGLGGAIRILKSSFEGLYLSIGKSVEGIFVPLAKGITLAVNAIAALPSPVLAIGVAFASLAVLSGSLLVALAALPTIAGVLTSGLSVLSGGMLALGEVIFSVTGSTALMGSALGLATAPIAAIVATIGEFVIVAVALGLALDELESRTHILSNSWAILQDLFTIAVHDLKELIGSIRNYVVWWIDDIKSAFENTGITEFINSIEDAYNEIASFFGGVQSDIHESAESIREEEDKAALSAKNVQKSIEDSQNGVSDSYMKTNDAAGNSYADMIEQAGNFSSGATSANEDVISSNSDLISSTDDVTSSIKTLQSTASSGFTLGETNVANIFSDKPKNDLDDINKGIELADGSMLTFNKSGELVIQTVDGITKKVSELSSTMLSTANGDKIGILSSGTKSLYSETPTKTISMEEAKQNAVSAEAYLNSSDYKIKTHAAEMGYTVLDVTNPISKEQYYTPQEQAKISSGEWTGPIQTPTAVRIKTLKDSDENIKAAARETSDEYKKRLTEWNNTEGSSGIGKSGKAAQEYQTGSWGQFFKNAFTIEGPSFSDTIKNWIGNAGEYFTDSITKLKDFTSGVGEYSNEASIAGTTTQSWNETFKKVTGIDLSGIINQVMDVTSNSDKATTGADDMGKSIHSASIIDLSGLYNMIFGVGEQEVTASDKAKDHKGVLDILKNVSFESLKNSIFGVGNEQDISSGKASDHENVLNSLGGVSFSGLIDSIFGIGSEQDTSKEKATGHKTILDSLNGISFGSLINNIFGIGTEQDTAGSKGTTHKGILDTIESTTMGSIIAQIFGIGSEQDTASVKATGHKGVLDLINLTSMSAVISQIFGVGQESDTSRIKGDLLKGAYDLVNGVSLGSLIGQISGVGTTTNIVSGFVSTLHNWIAGLNNISLSTISSTIDSLITKASNMYSTVQSYASKASSLISSAASSASSALGWSTGQTSSEGVTVVAASTKINTVNNYATSVIKNAIKSVI